MESDFLTTIWNEFGVETEEHCEEIERLLLEAESGSLDEDGVAQLFRSYHSLKGLAKAMDLVAMATVAHRAEDLLGLVRDGSLAMSSEIASLLLESLDHLKALRAHAVAEHADVEAPEEVIGRLRATFEAAGGSGFEDDAPVFCCSQSVSTIALHDDPEMLQLFIELLQGNVPAIARVIEPAYALGGEGDRQACIEVIEKAAEGLDVIEHASSVMGFSRISEVVGTIRGALPCDRPMSPDERETLVVLLQDLHEQVKIIEVETGKDMGGSDLSRILGTVVQGQLDRLFDDILKRIALLAQDEDDASEVDDVLVAEELYLDLTTANSHLAFFFPEIKGELLLLLVDVYGRVARNGLNIFNKILDISREVIEHIRHTYHQYLKGVHSCLNCDCATCRGYDQMILDYIWTYESGVSGENPVGTVREFIKQLKISTDLVEILTPDNVRDLMAAMHDGQQLYEILVHLESSEELAMGFLGWVSEQGRVITNRSVIIGEVNWYEMLMVSALDKGAVEAALAKIDPGMTLLQLKSSSSDVQLAEVALSAPEKAATGRAASANSANVLRVQGEVLDHFMNQIGEMVLARSQLNHILIDERFTSAFIKLRQSLERSGSEERLGYLDLLDEQQKLIAETDTLIHATLNRLQESVMGLRVMPVDTVFKRFPRVVRDLSQALDKQVRMEFSGQEVKIDKAMVEILADPLLHMVRNAVDHGIEMPEQRAAAGKPKEATVQLNAWQQGNSVIVQVIDDGAGIDHLKIAARAVERGLVKESETKGLSKEEIYQFLFLPGFSTAAVITETSGRGVGMDVVRTNVLRLGGSIKIESVIGRGTTFTLQMPLSAAVMEVLMVASGGQTLALPGRYVSEILEVEDGEIQSVKGRQAILLRGRFLPLVPLGNLLGFGSVAAIGKSRVAVVLSNGQHSLGIVVERVVARQELYTKDIQACLAGLPGVGGASILGNGRVVLILDGEALFSLAEKMGPEIGQSA